MKFYVRKDGKLQEVTGAFGIALWAAWLLFDIAKVIFILLVGVLATGFLEARIMTFSTAADVTKGNILATLLVLSTMGLALGSICGSGMSYFSIGAWGAITHDKEQPHLNG